MEIIIDPGHGGEDVGAVGDYSYEEEINLEIGKVIYSISDYVFVEINVRVTRAEDRNPGWANRVKSNKEDVFVSIHCNYAEDEETEGIETFYYPGSKWGRRLANITQDKLIKFTSREDRGIKSRDDLYVLRETKCPAVLVECGFITNQEEERLLNSLNYQVKIAAGIVDALREYLRLKKRGGHDDDR